MDKKLQELKNILSEVYDLEKIDALLWWDQATYMPPGGAHARSRQEALVGRLAHELFIQPEVGRLLEALRPYEENLPYDSDDASLIRVTSREFERLNRVPPSFTAELSAHAADFYQAWSEARPANDFKRLQNMMEKSLDFSRQYSDFFPGYAHILDPLIEREDEGMTVASIKSLFTELRSQLVPLVIKITECPPIDDSCLHRIYPEALQLEFAHRVVERLGYDFERGRCDKTLHPFQTEFSIGDVRITTRVFENNLVECLLGAVHEAGHGMYEQGISRTLEGTPLARGASAGLHESQSRLWENVVGRSREFWEYCFPQLQQAFPEQLGGTSLDEFHRAINKVACSLLRTEADEVTYDLHVMLRFDFEVGLLEGSLAVRDLPEAWRERYRSDLGIVPPDDRDGVMQDVHWFAGTIGGNFQGYTLGNILAAQFYREALKASPEIPDQMRSGSFEALHRWLSENIYVHGHKFTAPELVERVTCVPVRIQPYIDYLNIKYGQLYQI